jgi:hypothetical protein
MFLRLTAEAVAVLRSPGGPIPPGLGLPDGSIRIEPYKQANALNRQAAETTTLVIKWKVFNAGSLGYKKY